MECINPDLHIDIIGLGVAEQAALSREAISALTSADRIIGSERQQATIAHFLERDQASRCEPLPKIGQLMDYLGELSVTRLVILASGDPLYYGIGRWFSQHIPQEQLTFYPAVSSIQAACHRLGLSLQDVEVISLHGRPLEKIRTQLHRHQRLVILTDQYSQPQALARECIAAGFELSQLSVCENLGYRHEQLRHFSAAELCHDTSLSFDPLHVTVIEVKGQGGLLPEFPGIPDEHYITGREPGKGMISKREVRLVILSLLQVRRGDVVWDIGAGCGGVAVELAYWNPQAQVYAIEHHNERVNYLNANSERFGVSQHLQIIAGRAPEALGALPAPSKIFIGGSDGKLTELIDYAWQQLGIGGVLVASAVMDSSKAQLAAFAKATHHEAEMESVVLSVSRGRWVEDNEQAPTLDYVAKLPVEIMKFTKRLGDPS